MVFMGRAELEDKIKQSYVDSGKLKWQRSEWRRLIAELDKQESESDGNVIQHSGSGGDSNGRGGCAKE